MIKIVTTYETKCIDVGTINSYNVKCHYNNALKKGGHIELYINGDKHSFYIARKRYINDAMNEFNNVIDKQIQNPYDINTLDIRKYQTKD